ncbi:MAG: Orotidine 5'-phosphate decarboxylase [Chloroflexi bacterium]|nr:Orotidine 5'-phosphate decarboxylase [Chloroflexota bacterium]
METFFSRLKSRIRAVDSLLCVGLDPHPEDLPEFSGEAAKNFCRNIIEATSDVALAYKPNIAFFEMLGPEGMAALQEIIFYIPWEIPVILDAKRGDISSTAEAYAHALFRALDADAATINPYLGRDAVEPFTRDPEKGAFLLCKTSNPSAGDLQDLALTPNPSPTRRGGLTATSPLPVGEGPGVRGGVPLHLHVARLAQSWNRNDNLGLVVGATQPDSLARVREAAPDLWILAPGVGAQGGNLGAALKAGLRPDGLGMVIPVSRGISRARNPRKAARDLRAAINQEREVIGNQYSRSSERVPDHRPLTADHSLLADGLLEAGCIKFGRFTLKSGQESPIYIDLRRLAHYPALLLQVAESYLAILRKLEFDHLAPLPYAAMPIGTAISLYSGWPMVYPRKEAKEYGTKAQVEGVFREGERAVVIDDLISTGGSKLEGISKLAENGLDVKDVVVLIDRSRNGAAELAAEGYHLHAVLTLPDLLEHYEGKGAVSAKKIDEVKKFLESGEQ